MFSMNALPTNQQTDRPTDTAYNRDARTHLKIKKYNIMVCVPGFQRENFNLLRDMIWGRREWWEGLRRMSYMNNDIHLWVIQNSETHDDVKRMPYACFSTWTKLRRNICITKLRRDQVGKEDATGLYIVTSGQFVSLANGKPSERFHVFQSFFPQFNNGGAECVDLKMKFKFNFKRRFSDWREIRAILIE